MVPLHDESLGIHQQIPAGLFNHGMPLTPLIQLHGMQGTSGMMLGVGPAVMTIHTVVHKTGIAIVSPPDAFCRKPYFSGK